MKNYTRELFLFANDTKDRFEVFTCQRCQALVICGPNGHDFAVHDRWHDMHDGIRPWPFVELRDRFDER